MRGIGLLTFWVVAILPLALAATDLTPNAPVDGFVSAGTWSVYRVDLTGQTEPVEITVTPLADGDPDLYVWYTDLQEKNCDVGCARRFGTDTVTLSPDEWTNHTELFAGVYGFRNTSFSVVSTFTHTVMLDSNKPQSGTTVTGGNAYFEFVIPDGLTEITLHVTPTSGNVGVYMSKTGPPVPGDTNTYQRSTGFFFSGEPLHIRSTEDVWPTADPKNFYIGVHGYSEASFTVMVAANSTYDNAVLPVGQPLYGATHAGSYSWYTMTVMSSGCLVDVTVTPLTGDPDLYMSTTLKHPDKDNHDPGKSSGDYGADEVRYEDAAAGEYYIGVYGFGTRGNTTFTLLGRVTCADDNVTIVPLVQGVPQTGVLDAGAWKYYHYYVPEGVRDVTFSVQRTYGDPDLFVIRDDLHAYGTLPSQLVHEWKAVEFGGDVLTIEKLTDATFCDGCYLTVGVNGASDCAFSLIAANNNGSVTLTDGRAVIDYSRKGQYEYYKIEYKHSQSTELTISVTDLGGGDPDLFVSTRYKRPRQGKSDWSARSWGSDSVTIAHDDEHGCIDTPFWQPCWYYISVLGFSNSSFSLVASFFETIELADNIPQTVFVTEGARKFFTIRVPESHKDLTFLVTELDGTASLYVGNGATFPSSSDPNSYIESRSWWMTEKRIIIHEADDSACKNVSCEYKISVQGHTDSTFIIRAFTNNATLPLILGTPQTGVLNTSEWAYYSVEKRSRGTIMSIILTALTGDPDIFVSRNTSRPSENNYEQKSTRWGNDIIDLNPARPGVYYIGVRAFSSAGDNHGTTYSLLAQTFPDHQYHYASRLLPGHPQTGRVGKTFYKYYRINLPDGAPDLTISVSPEYGDPDLYVNKVPLNATSADLRWPTKDAADYSSQFSSDDHVTIDNAEAGSYIVGVYGFRTSVFLVTATLGESTQQLVEGVSVRGNLQANTSDYYSISVDSEARGDLVITVTAFSGDPDIFADRTNHHPGKNAEFSATTFRDDSLIVHKTIDGFVATYYIAVYAFSDCDYSIVASRNTPQWLTDGVPQRGSVVADGWNYYKIRPSDDHTDVTFSLVPLEGNPVLFVRRNEEPTLEDHDWQTSLWSGGDTLVIHPGDDQKACHSLDCEYYLGVYSSINAARYTLIASTSMAATNLIDGEPVRDYVQAKRFEYFIFTARKPGVDVVVTVTPISGDPDLYIDTKTFPNLENYTDVSQNPGGDALSYMNISEGTVLFIGVYGFENTSFSVTAFVYDEDKESETTLLVDGVPQTGYAPGDHFRYYTLYVAEGETNLQVSVTSDVGDPDLYYNDPAHPWLPTVDNSTGHHAFFGDDVVVIRRPQKGYYTFGVYAFSATLFTISASSSQSIRTLQLGRPFLDRLERSEYEFFQVPIRYTFEDLTITVTPFTGDPDLFVTKPSSNITRPDNEHYDYKSVAFREDSITIPSDALEFGNYHIGVRAFTNSSFSLIAQLAFSQYLFDGYPQDGSVHKHEMRYYDFSVPEGTTKPVQISVTPKDGYVFLYVGTKHKPVYGNSTTYRWSSRSFSKTQKILINANDPHLCEKKSAFGSCRLKIGVYGLSAANYSVSGTYSGISTLIDGVPESGTVREGEYRHFRYYLGLSGHALLVSLTTDSGDADLYASMEIGKDNQANATWRSEMFGADVVHVAPGDDGYALGTYYIGVRGYSNCSYSITAQRIDLSGLNVSETLLIDGQAQLGWIGQADTYRYYYFNAHKDSTEYTFTVVPKYGDPDLYVRDDGQRPGKDVLPKQWESTRWGMDAVTPSPSCDSCTYRIGVYGFQPTLYTIVAESRDIQTTLVDGSPLQSRLEANRHEYFAFTVLRDTADIHLSVTPITGDPDIFVSIKHRHPMNASTSEWSSQRFGADELTIQQTEGPKTYYITVRAFLTGTVYFISASVGAKALVPSVPSHGAVAFGETALYVLHVYEDIRVDISLTLTAEGSIGLYFGSTADGYSVDNPPSEQNNRYSNEVSETGVPNNIIIDSGADGSCSGATCRYFIAVNGTSSSASFDLLASLGSVYLLSDRPLLDAVATGEKNVYLGTVFEGGHDISVETTQYSGSIELYVSDQEHAIDKNDPKTYNWSDTNGNRVFIQSDDVQEDTTYQIAIYGVGAYDSAYSVVFTTGASMLQLGRYLAVNAEADGNFFFFSLNTKQDITIKLDQFTTSTDRYNIYVSASNTATKPDSGNSEFSLENVGPGQSLSIYKKDACDECTYHIGVRPVDGNSNDGGYFITASGGGSVDVLIDKTEIGPLDVGLHTSRFYTFYVEAVQNVTFYLETCSGNADLYVSETFQQPRKGHAEWSSDREDSVDFVEIARGDIQKASFHVGVYGKAGQGGLDPTFKLEAASGELELGYVPRFTGGLINNSRVLLSTPARREIQVEFLAAQPAAGSPSADTDLEYYVHYARRSQSYVMYSVCGVERATAVPAVSGFSVGDTVTVSIVGLDVGVEYDVNVIASDPAGGKVVFTSGDIRVTDKSPGGGGGGSSSTLKYVLGIGIPVVILIVAIVIYLSVKNRKLTQELDIEMTDVPNRALRKAVRGPPSLRAESKKEAKKYTSLLTLESDTEADYSPPAAEEDEA